jgi:hypothetical protein
MGLHTDLWSVHSQYRGSDQLQSLSVLLFHFPCRSESTVLCRNSPQVARIGELNFCMGLKTNLWSVHSLYRGTNQLQRLSVFLFHFQCRSESAAFCRNSLAVRRIGELNFCMGLYTNSRSVFSPYHGSDQLQSLSVFLFHFQHRSESTAFCRNSLAVVRIGELNFCMGLYTSLRRVHSLYRGTNQLQRLSVFLFHFQCRSESTALSRNSLPVARSGELDFLYGLTYKFME